jgi:hypothetical protein
MGDFVIPPLPAEAAGGKPLSERSGGRIGDEQQKKLLKRPASLEETLLIGS